MGELLFLTVNFLLSSMVQFKPCPFLNFIGPSAAFISLKFCKLTICFIDVKLRKPPEVDGEDFTVWERGEAPWPSPAWSIF